MPNTAQPTSKNKKHPLGVGVAQAPLELKHAFLTGPVNGQVGLEDGTVIDVTPFAIEVDHLTDDQRDELSFILGEHWVANGHPDDVEVDDDEDSPTFGERVQRPFVHDHHERFNKHPLKFKGQPAGIPRREKKDD